MDLFADEGVPVVILGMPAMRNAYHQSKMARINAVTRAACERAGAYFVDTFAMTADAAGNPVTRAEVDGRTRIVHAGDGMHLSVYGSDMVAAGIVDALADRFTFAPPAGTVAGGVAAAAASAGGASVAEAAPPDTSRPAATGRAAAVAAPQEADRPAATERPAGPRARPGGPAAEAVLGLDREAQRLIQRGCGSKASTPARSTASSAVAHGPPSAAGRRRGACPRPGMSTKPPPGRCRTPKRQSDRPRQNASPRFRRRTSRASNRPIRALTRPRRTVTGLSAMIWDIRCRPFVSEGSIVIRKSGASARVDVI